jgi:uncharacterized Zn-finger protein
VYSTGCITNLCLLKQRHEKSARNSQHVCKACSKTFARRANLRQHLIRNHKELDVKTECPFVTPRCKASARLYVCSTCDLRYSCGDSLRRHIRSHHADIDTETLSTRKERKKKMSLSHHSRQFSKDLVSSAVTSRMSCMEINDLRA